ncbi:hypothetical protein CL1_0392 [Thermococcus cleftensis]|uniref:Class III signal peptide-containing protein n=1 Tax=Thermococcus cleftensis (strain DSM 27260 / KACC 17922 / CL1) TaxID=163003 RepID=I3ZSB9_THECF|nr:hypothetical protein [Thermococcus cleftensis]AFL94603.1 hypothetical protein CL1_0392 [Thermococcus cleftensis]
MRKLRRAQAAIEYLFMIALSLVMVLIIFRAIQQAANSATRQIETASDKMASELSQIAQEG